MFTYLKLNNFKSFNSLYANFKNKSKNPKNMIYIYGENGAGKSNLMYSFMFLKNTLETLSSQKFLLEFLLKKKEDLKINENNFKLFYNRKHKQLEQLIQDTKLIGSKDNMIIECGFIIDGKEGSYVITFNQANKVISEKLYYLIDDRSGYLFEINESDVILSPSIFTDKSYKEELIILIEKFWGKHTFLSILSNEQLEKNYNFISKRVSRQILKVLDFFHNYSVQCKIGNREEMGYTAGPHEILVNLDKGKINKNEIDILKTAENIIRIFFTGLYADVKDVFYEIKAQEEEIEYTLYFKKLIGEEIIKIDFSFESTGTQKLLQILPLIIQCAVGDVVIIDEFDSGIHDVLINEVLMELSEYISGQLICTTHNTSLMEKLNRDNVYFLNVDNKGNKELLCVNDFEERTQNNHNLRNRYLKGMYKAIPNINSIDFDELTDNLLLINNLSERSNI